MKRPKDHSFNPTLTIKHPFIRLHPSFLGKMLKLLQILLQKAYK
jgi:hypothetical protein